MDREHDLGKVLSSAGLMFVGTVFGSVAVLFERVLLGRVLSANAYGEFSIAVDLMMLAVTLALAGYQQGIPRFMARYDSPADIRGTWVTGLVVTLPIAGGICVLLLVFDETIVSLLFEDARSLSLLLLFVLTIPFVVTFSLGVSAIRGFEKTRYKIVAEDIGYPSLRLLVLALLLAAGMDVIATGYSYLIAAVLTTVVTFALLRRFMPLFGSFTLHVREITAFSTPLVVSTVVSTLLARTDTLMLGYFRSSTEVGIYNSAYPLAGALVLLLGTFGYLYLPVASRLDNKDDLDGVKTLYTMTSKWTYVLTFPIFVLFVVFPGEIISLTFGDEYSTGGVALAILSIGFFINAAVGRNRETLSAFGYTKFILITNVAAFIVNVVGNLVLIPLYGFIGAAIASAASYIALNILIYAFLSRNFDVRPFTETSIRAVVALPLVLLPFGFLFRSVVPTTALTICAFAIVVTVLTLGIVIASRSLETYDLVFVEFLEEIIQRRIPGIRQLIPDS
ncbi:oligosaccharide flippase family protein [Natronorubrum halophilum]|uniref:oligosaccharide flippase family protein n=1 Tax=Natronorubrum halophilum TaxID=1702106 RepID=UPI000EF6F592|nr:oligosaccharide flippase family protein [Natronorubrum halophilum]